MKSYCKIICLIVLITAINLLSKEIIAKVGSKSFSKTDFENYALKNVFKNDTIDAAHSLFDRRRELLQDMINFELIGHLADSLQLDTMKIFKEKYQRRLKAVGKTHHFFPDSIRRKVFSDEDITNEYLKLKYQYKAKHIFVGISKNNNLQTKSLIDSIYKEIINNISLFSNLALEFSEDIHSAKNGGNLGWIKLDNYIPEFEDSISSLHIGELSHPFKTDVGWHIVYLDDKKIDKSVSSFEKETGKIVNKLKKRYHKKYLSANYSFYEFLFKKYNVFFNYSNIDLFIKNYNTLKYDGNLVIAQRNVNKLYSRDIIENIEDKVDFNAIHQFVYNHFAKTLTNLAVVDLGYINRQEVINLAKEGMLIEYKEYFTTKFKRNKDQEKKWFEMLYNNFNVDFNYLVLETTFNYSNDDRK